MLQIHLITQCRTEMSNSARGIIFTPVEPPINRLLKATVQGLEQRCNDQCRTYDCHIIATCESTEERLQSHNDSKVQAGEQHCQRTIDQRAINKRINIPKVRTQNRDRNGDREEQQQSIDESSTHEEDYYIAIEDLTQETKHDEYSNQVASNP